jgi:hypothetical protein
MRITRPSEQVIVLTNTRFSALVRLAIWLSIVATFYSVLLGDVSSFEFGSARSMEQLGHARWLLVIVPLFLLPYLIDIARVLVHGESSVFNADLGELRTADHRNVPFAQIRAMELRAVNGGCEELALSARLYDGTAINLLTDDASARIVDLAQEISALVGVEAKTL